MANKKKSNKSVKKDQTKKEVKTVNKDQSKKNVKEKKEPKVVKKEIKVTKKKDSKIKKGSEKIKLNISGTNDELNKVIKCLVIVAVIFCAVYLLTVYITKHGTDSDFKKTVGEATIQHEKILAGSTFEQKDKEYYVLFYNTTKDYTYTDIYSSYKEKEGHTPIYYVDTKEGLNSKYVGDEENTNPKDISELKVKGVTLMKVKDKEVVEYTTNEDEIKSKLS